MREWGEQVSEHTPGPWKACNNGECSCLIISSADNPVAKVMSGKWVDDFPALRLVGDSTLDQKTEAYMEQIPYGEIDPAVAKANALFIVRACNAHEGLLEALRAIADPAVPNSLGEPDSRLYLAQQIARVALA